MYLLKGKLGLNQPKSNRHWKVFFMTIFTLFIPHIATTFGWGSHTLDNLYLEGRKADGTSQADPQTHAFVTETLAFTPRLQQTGWQCFFWFHSLLIILLTLACLHWGGCCLRDETRQKERTIRLQLFLNKSMQWTVTMAITQNVINTLILTHRCFYRNKRPIWWILHVIQD